MNKTIGIVDNSANKRIIKKLNEQGFEIILIPAISTEKYFDKSANIEIEKLLNFDWLIFTDIYSVDYFIEVLTNKNFNLFELDNLRVCAFGEVVADRLRFSQIHSDIIPGNLSSETILEDLKNYIASDNEKIQQSILIVKEQNENIELLEQLKNSFRNAVEYSVYMSKINKLDGISKIRVLINNGAFDEVRFFSAEDLHAFLKIAGLKSLKKLSQKIKLTSDNETILKSIDELKF